MTDTPLLITGKRIGFGPIRSDLLETYQRWFNTVEVIRSLAVPVYPMTVEAEQQWLEDALTNDNDIYFTMYLLSGGQPLGNVSLMNVDLSNQIAEFGIFIGETELWNHGYGTEATRLMLAYAFDVIGLQNVLLEVNANNQGGITAYERAGFKQIGIRRAASRLGRIRYDVLLMDAVADDFEPSELHDLMHLTSDVSR